MPDSSTTKPTSVPETDFDAIPGPDPHSPTFARDLSTFVRKTLLASPSFPRMYADVVLRYAPNSRAAKILRPHYQEILEKVNMAIQQQKSRNCSHIKVTGVPCGSPSLRGEQFCYFHQRMHRGVRTPPQARLHPIACLEDGESIQAALMEVINALMRNTIDLKRANLILRALHIAVKNASRVRFDLRANEVIREIPEYNPAPPDQGLQRSEIEPPLTAASEPYQEPSPAKLTAEQIRADNIRADQRRYAAKMQAAVDRQADIRARLERVAKTLPPRGRVTPAPQSTATVHPDGTAHLETAAPGCPALTTNAATNPAHIAADAFARQAPQSPAPDSMKKKPSMPVKEAAAPISARAASSLGGSAAAATASSMARSAAAAAASSMARSAAAAAASSMARSAGAAAASSMARSAGAAAASSMARSAAAAAASSMARSAAAAAVAPKERKNAAHGASRG